MFLGVGWREFAYGKKSDTDLSSCKVPKEQTSTFMSARFQKSFCSSYIIVEFKQQRADSVDPASSSRFNCFHFC